MQNEWKIKNKNPNGSICRSINCWIGQFGFQIFEPYCIGAKKNKKCQRIKFKRIKKESLKSFQKHYRIKQTTTNIKKSFEIYYIIHEQEMWMETVFFFFSLSPYLIIFIVNFILFLSPSVIIIVAVELNWIETILQSNIINKTKKFTNL